MQHRFPFDKSRNSSRLLKLQKGMNVAYETELNNKANILCVTQAWNQSSSIFTQGLQGHLTTEHPYRD